MKKTGKSFEQKGKPGIKPSGEKTFLAKIETKLIKNEPFLFYTLCILSVIFSFFLFNARVSEGNDDSLYIEAGYKYAHDFAHYSYLVNAPFYPLFLGLLTYVFGLKLIIFKLFSEVFNFVGLFFLYKSFKGRIPYLVLFTVCFTVAVNNYFLYYASQTYSESLFLCIQFIFLYYFFKLLDKIDGGEEIANFKHIGLWLTTGGVLFLLMMIKNIAIASIPAMVLFFIFKKKYRCILWSICSFLIFRGFYEIIHGIFWQQKRQYSISGGYWFKDPYNAQLGKEDLAGIISRFFENIQLYLSKRFFQILGFFSDTQTETNIMWALIVIALLIIGFIKSVKFKNNVLLFSTLFMTSMAAMSFVVLHARWDQPRIIMIHMPIMLVAMLFGIYQMVQKSSLAQNLFVFLCILLVSSGLISSIGKAATNIPILMKNIKGDKLYGYTADWKNFFKISEWCSENLPDTALVASRKAPMSFIYGNGKHFFPVYKVVSLDSLTGYSNPDSVMNFFRRNKVTHIILASLRRNPSKADGNIINTLHRMVEPVAQKYPNSLSLIYQVPPPNEAQVEPAYLYKINY